MYLKQCSFPYSNVPNDNGVHTARSLLGGWDCPFFSFFFRQQGLFNPMQEETNKQKVVWGKVVGSENVWSLPDE